MRFSPVFLAMLFIALSYGISIGAQASTLDKFASNMSLGFSGEQVAMLQRVLNWDRDTRVADEGSGSPGNETIYFGPLTKSAVVRFQEKYANEVLAPAGLTRGSGYVGFYTRAKLNALVSSGPAPGPGTSSVMPVVTPTPSSYTPASPSVAPTAVSSNPNFKNLGKFLADVNRVGTAQGLSSTELSVIRERIIEKAATTTDMRAAFLDIVKAKDRKTADSSSFFGKILAFGQRVFSDIFRPEQALAAVGSPFGGRLLYADYCEDSGTWIIDLEPLPPTYAAVLTYTPFTQVYLSYNIPDTEWLLGEYEPLGTCVVYCPYCVTLPSEGMISPTVGSSPI